VIAAKDFSHLLGSLTGISDRALSAHLELYRQQVARLSALGAARPGFPPGLGETLGGAPERALAALLRSPVASLDLEPTGPLAESLRTVEGELAGRGMSFRPKWYLGGDDFWTADRGVGVNIPWFYANITLWGLANRNEQSAYTPEQMLRTLRHEAGHAVCYAFELWREPEWVGLFGDSLEPYRESYAVGDSRAHVEYLQGVSRHYPQKHPDEDFAETFACWLDPASIWEQQYAEWPVALAKLQYVQALWLQGRFSSNTVNQYLGRTEPYTRIAGTVGQALGVVAQAPAEEPLVVTKEWETTRNGVCLHEAFFEVLGGVEPPGERFLTGVILAFGGWESYLADLRRCARAVDEHGWVLTLWDEREGRLENLAAEGDTAPPLGTRLLLALDLHEHAFMLDYGAAKHVGFAAVLVNVNWGLVEYRLAQVAPALSFVDDSFAVEQPEPEESGEVSTRSGRKR